MGTETILPTLGGLGFYKIFVKLNNPQMGTETSRYIRIYRPLQK